MLENYNYFKVIPFSSKKWVTRKKTDVYSTRYSQAVTHPGTNRARRCLTSVIGREPVLSTWYGRRHLMKLQTALYSKIFKKLIAKRRENKILEKYNYFKVIPFSSKKWVTRKKMMSTAPGIPRRSPIQVLTGPDVA